MKKFSVKKGTLPLRWVSSPDPFDCRSNALSSELRRFYNFSHRNLFDTQRSRSVPFFAENFFKNIYLVYLFKKYFLKRSILVKEINVDKIETMNYKALTDLITNMCVPWSLDRQSLGLTERWFAAKNARTNRTRWCTVPRVHELSLTPSRIKEKYLWCFPPSETI